MICSYGFSLTGSSHINNGTGCQDANATRPDSGKGSIVIAAVADGVGSCKYSDVASKIAVDVSTSICESMINQNPTNGNLVSIIEEAFTQAEVAIEKQSLEDNQPLPEYDTTLDLVIYDGKRIAYGHSGDGGIIGLTIHGDYVRVTYPQKKEGIFVVPLRNGSKSKNGTWAFGFVDEDFASVLLATDGVYDMFFPYLLQGQSVDVYVPLIQYFMDNTGIHMSSKTLDEISRTRMEFLNSAACVSVTDDKTVLVMINEDVIPKRKEAAFYLEPDWELLKKEWDKKAYPHLYKIDASSQVVKQEE
jgi:serine/threonine protein phosphatase PrpC